MSETVVGTVVGKVGHLAGFLERSVTVSQFAGGLALRAYQPLAGGVPLLERPRSGANPKQAQARRAPDSKTQTIDFGKSFPFRQLFD